MKLSTRVLVMLALAVSVGAAARLEDVLQGQVQAELTSQAHTVSSTLVACDPSPLGIHLKVTHYATGFDGDHSLQEATVVEQAFARYTLYTVRLQFASGAEQSVVLTAPPGGLEPEIRDMSGDSVPNDLILTPRLFRLPLIVLLNEGRDHLTVAIAPGSFTSGEGRASGPHQTHLASALVTSGFKKAQLPNCGSTPDPQLKESLLSPLTRAPASHADGSSASGRAPPIPAKALWRIA